MADDKWLEVIGIVAAGAVAYLVVESNPEIKQKISNIITHGPVSISAPKITPISTTYPRPPVPQSKHCPEGMYADYTDGILTCRDAHGTRELDPHVKRLIPQQQWAYGYDFAEQPNMTQPLVQPNINKQIESEIKKKHQKEVKDQKVSSTTKRLIRERATDVYTPQVECPHDLNMIDCGNHCMKNGHVMVVDCSGVEHPSKKKDKEKEKKQPKSVVVPPNFPGSVTITPGETPYPEDVGGTAPQQTVGQTNPDWNPPSLDLTPGQQPIKPTIPPGSPGQAPTPSAPAPSLHPFPPLIPEGSVFYPFSPAKDNYKKQGFADHPFNKDGCRVVDYHSGGSGWTCRWQADNDVMKRKIGENGYKIEATLHIGPKKVEKDKEISITSGGPGSTEGNCCGFTTRINIDDGTLQLEAEGPAHTEVIYCKGSQCVAPGQPTSISKIVNGKRQPLYGENIQLTWTVTRRGNTAIYQASAKGPGGTVVSKSFSSDDAIRARGKPLIPFHYIAVTKIASDPHRIRVDSADMHAIDFGTPKVTVLSAGAYYGDEGYIDGIEDLLI